MGAWAEAGALRFTTALGPAALAWRGEALVALELEDPLLARALEGRGESASGAGGAAPAAPLREPTGSGAGRDTLRGLPWRPQRLAPPWVRGLVRRVRAHLEGRPQDFSDLVLAWPEDATEFQRKVWEGARRVPPGLTISYGELAAELGRPGAARAVGSAMRRCPVTLVIPAHRVISAGRRPGGWTGPGGLSLKRRLLELEGVWLPGWGDEGG